MGRYGLWAGQNYYPSAGIGDFVAEFDSQIEAESVGRRIIDEREEGWWEVVDLTTMGKVSEGHG